MNSNVRAFADFGLRCGKLAGEFYSLTVPPGHKKILDSAIMLRGLAYLANRAESQHMPLCFGKFVQIKRSVSDTFVVMFDEINLLGCGHS